MKKLFLCLILPVLLCCAALAAAETEDGITYVVLEDGTAEITLYQSLDTRLVIPEQVGGHTVTRIGPYALVGTYANSIEIPDTVVGIEGGLVASVYVSEFIVSPEHPVFTVEGKMLLQKADRCLVGYAGGPDYQGITVEIPADVTDVADGVFAFFEVSAFIVPDGHPTLAVVDGALYNKADHRLITCCDRSAGGSFKVREGTEIIGDWAFESCDYSSYELPNSLKRIGRFAFADNYYLQSITLPEGLIDIGDFAFHHGSLKEIVLPDSLRSIGDFVFANCNYLEEIKLPDHLTALGDGAFAYSYSLARFIVTPEQEHFAVIDGVLYRKADRCLMAFPPAWGKKTTEYDEGSSVEWEEWMAWEKEKEAEREITFTVPQGIAGIGAYAFANCGNLVEITLPDTLTSIGEGAFSGCSGLKEITIPDGVTSLGSDEHGFGITLIAWNGIFNGCSSLSTIVLPDSLTRIGDRTFYDCYSLTEIVLPDSVTRIGDSAFEDCRSLTEIVLPDSLTSIGDRAFYSCSGLTEIVLPDSVMSIGDGAFEYCRGLTEMILPDGVTSIGDRAFDGCSSLTKIVLPDSLTGIGDYALGYCRGLTEITLPAGQVSIAEDAFYGCDNVTFIVTRNSAAAAYVREHGFTYQYTDAMDWLTGPVEEPKGNN